MSRSADCHAQQLGIDDALDPHSAGVGELDLQLPDAASADD
jgi:hypothetical protein